MPFVINSPTCMTCGRLAANACSCGGHTKPDAPAEVPEVNADEMSEEELVEEIRRLEEQNTESGEHFLPENLTSILAELRQKEAEMSNLRDKLYATETEMLLAGNAAPAPPQYHKPLPGYTRGTPVTVNGADEDFIEQSRRQQSAQVVANAGQVQNDEWLKVHRPALYYAKKEREAVANLVANRWA